MASSDSPKNPVVELALEAPKVPVILKDENGQESPEGLLPRDALSGDLVVVVPNWSAAVTAAEPLYIIDISWTLEGGPFTSVFSDQFEEPGDKTLKVPRDKLDQGTYSLSYRVNYGGNHLYSALKRVTVDRSPPNDNQEPVRLDMLDVPGVITDDYLTQHGKVEFQVPLYVDAKVRDRAIFYWSDDPTPPDSEIEIGEKTFNQQDIDDKRLIITVPESVIRQRGAGQRYVFYRLRDWAGNRGPRSTLLAVSVDLSAAPGNLKPPRVPLSVRGLLDRQHAREGAVDQGAVTVEIDEYDDVAVGDQILIKWNGHDLGSVDVDPDGFPLKTTVPWATLIDDGLGPAQATVLYRVRRGGTLTLPSPEIKVPYNFTVAGQDHDSAPALLNPTLAKLQVYGAVSNQLNTLLPGDFGKPAEARLTLYDNPLPGQKVLLYWGTIPSPVAEYEVKSGDVAGKIIPLSIAWEFIEKDKVNPALPTWYATSNGVNEQLAQVTPLNLAIVVIDNLPEPVFTHADRDGVLHCCARPRLWEGVWVHIKGNAAFAEKDVVELTWQGCANQNGSSPIAGTDESFEVTLTDDQARDGFDVHVSDYPRLIAPMVDNGSALCRYYLRKHSGGLGSSKPDFVIINRTMPSGDVCGPDNDICQE